MLKMKLPFVLKLGDSVRLEWREMCRPRSPLLYQILCFLSTFWPFPLLPHFLLYRIKHAPQYWQNLRSPVTNPFSSAAPSPEFHRDPNILAAVLGLVETSLGPVSGYVGASSTRYTIPYAQPPIGPLRFTNPQASVTHRGVYNAQQLPQMCAQNYYGPMTGSEDCLYLNIYIPHLPVSSNLPVFVWVHGGSFVAGSSTASGLDGTTLANSQDMIVVTLQYRLGLLGFLSSTDLGISGNFGLKDIILALKYIQTNIGAFGGDSTRVTLAGQSSGAELIKTLLVTPSATSLFNNVILHSPPLGHPDLTPSLATQVGRSVATILNCTTSACIQSSSLISILDAQADLMDSSSPYYAGYVSPVIVSEPIRPVIDGTLVARSFNSVTERSASLGFSKPMIFTTVKDEACQVISEILPSPVGSDYFDYVLGAFLADRATPIEASGLYDPSLLSSDVDAVRDELLTAPVQQSAVNISSSGARNVYLAQFDMGISYANGTIPYCVGKVDHQDDIYPLFQAAKSPGNLSRAVINMSNELQARWGAFARTGNPNVYGIYSAVWSPVGSALNLNLLVFGVDGRGGSAVVATQRPAEDGVGGLWGYIVPFDFQLV